jgi:transglutaminase-like putative cysteine protease
VTTLRGFVLACLAGLSLGQSGCARRSQTDNSRTFRFTYAVAVENIPTGARELSIWVPVPKTDRHQVVRDLKITSPVNYKILEDKKYGNSILHLDTTAPLPARLEFQLEAVVERRAYNVLQEKDRRADDHPTPEDLAPDRLVPTDGIIADVALEVTKGASSPIEKAKAIYDYVTETMRYDKTGTGWGRGDAVYACNERAGNCTDFHSLIIGMARACGIPARFVIGFPLPENQKRGEISGYHCWAELYVDGIGWLPVDSSEANRHPGKRGAFFGGLDANRVQFSGGTSSWSCRHRGRSTFSCIRSSRWTACPETTE